MEFSEQVLLLRVGRFREADLWVRFLSPSRGILTAFAFGGSRSRRRFIGCLDIFNEVAIKAASSGRGAYLVLREGLLVSGPVRLRGDRSRLGMAANCSAFLQAFGVGAEGADAAYLLLRQTLDLLEQETGAPGPLPFLFRARMAFDQGYALETDRCAVCGTLLGEVGPQGCCLLLREGQFVCRSCSLSRYGQRLFLGPAALGVLDAVRRLSPVSWSDLPLSPPVARECARVIDGFIQYHVGIRWEEGRFVKGS